jgi:hypothetical protein
VKPALECGSLLPLSFAGSLPPAAPRASSRRKSGSPSVDGPHSKDVEGISICPTGFAFLKCSAPATPCCHVFSRG